MKYILAILVASSCNAQSKTNSFNKEDCFNSGGVEWHQSNLISSADYCVYRK